MNQELPDARAGFRKGRGTRDQIANICWIIEKARGPEKHLLLLYWLEQSLWLCGSQQTVENTSRDENTRPPNCLLRNLYVGQEATVTTRHGTMDWFQIRKGLCQGCILSPCLFNLYAEYILWNAGLDETQTRVNIVGRNINNLRYSDDISLTAENKEEIKASWWKCKKRVEKLV